MPTSRSPWHRDGRCPPRCAATGARRWRRWAITNAAGSSEGWSTPCWARSAPSGCWIPAGTSTNLPTSRCCWSRRSPSLMGDVALVTGAGSGLGAVIAERLAREGLTVAVNTRARIEEANAVAAAIRAGGGSAFAVTANVTDPTAVRRMFETVADKGTLRVLVNNASYRPRQHV